MLTPQFSLQKTGAGDSCFSTPQDSHKHTATKNNQKWKSKKKKVKVKCKDSPLCASISPTGRVQQGSPDFAKDSPSLPTTADLGSISDMVSCS
jgi:hypothetical protein